jgi:pentose-5-phosphate-3-epimerase
MAVDIIPALLVRSKKDLGQGLERLRGVSSWVQIDLVGTNYIEGEENFPLWEEFNFEADLMLPNQLQVAESMVQVGAARIAVHAEESDAHEALRALQIYRTGDFAVEIGVALRSHDTPEALKEFEGLYDYVQVMGIDREGAQGEPPDPHGKDLELIRALRANHPSMLIQVDGAVAPRIKELVEAGASRLVVGSAIVNAENPKAAYKELYTVANGAQ